jgi:hypothetical protein
MSPKLSGLGSNAGNFDLQRKPAAYVSPLVFVRDLWYDHWQIPLLLPLLLSLGWTGAIEVATKQSESLFHSGRRTLQYISVD